MGPILLVFLVIIVLMALSRQQEAMAWPIVRDFLAREGFQNGKFTTLSSWLPDPGLLTKKTTCDDGRPAEQLGLKQGNFDLVGDQVPTKPLDRVAIGPTSQKCQQVDQARGLERAGSQAQRTNNQVHGTPDSCSAPNHDLILNFQDSKGFPTPQQV